MASTTTTRWMVYVPAVCAVKSEELGGSKSGAGRSGEPELGFAFLVHDPVAGRAWIVPRSASRINAFARALNQGEILPKAVWKEAKKVLPNDGKMVEIPELGARSGRDLKPRGSSFARFLFGEDLDGVLGNARADLDQGVLERFRRNDRAEVGVARQPGLG